MHNDPVWMQALLAIHIMAGAVCLVLAPFVLMLTKGGRRHRRWGKVYFWSMAVIGVTALPMALFRPVLFLAFIAALSFYLAFTGYRVLGLKKLASGGSAGLVDWFAAIVAFCACACLCGFAVFRPGWVQNMGIVAIVLGALGMRASASDMYRFVNKPTRAFFWVETHLERFIGSYIAALTAFSTVTLSRIFPNEFVAVWLWPAAVGLPATFLAAAYYRRKFSSAGSGAPVTQT